MCAVRHSSVGRSVRKRGTAHDFQNRERRVGGTHLSRCGKMMSTAYLRHCPKHSRPGRPMPNPCAHCALAAKPAQVPEPAPAGTIPAPSAAALRANKYRERQKQDHPNFKEKEAARKQQERREKKNQNAEKWSK